MNETQLVERLCETLEKAITVQVDMAKLTYQVGRVASDLDSEKRTRSDANKETRDTLKNQNDQMASMFRLIWIGFGAVLAMQFMVPMLFKK